MWLLSSLRPPEQNRLLPSKKIQLLKVTNLLAEPRMMYKVSHSCKELVTTRTTLQLPLSFGTDMLSELHGTAKLHQTHLTLHSVPRMRLLDMATQFASFLESTVTLVTLIRKFILVYLLHVVITMCSKAECQRTVWTLIVFLSCVDEGVE